MIAALLPTLSVEDLLRAQGACRTQPGRRQERLAAIAEEALAIGASLAAPVVAWSWREVLALHPGRLRLAGIQPLRHVALAEALAGATRVAAVALTLGPALERRASQEATSRPSLALALDAYGSLLLMRLAAETRTTLAAESGARGLALGRSLSPGMAGWPVLPGQAELLAMLEKIPGGITLTELGMLVPGKSLTFLAGAGVALEPGGDPCERCESSARCTHRARG